MEVAARIQEEEAGAVATVGKALVAATEPRHLPRTTQTLSCCSSACSAYSKAIPVEVAVLYSHRCQELGEEAVIQCLELEEAAIQCQKAAEAIILCLVAAVVATSQILELMEEEVAPCQEGGVVRVGLI